MNIAMQEHPIGRVKFFSKLNNRETNLDIHINIINDGRQNKNKLFAKY